MPYQKPRPPEGLPPEEDQTPEQKEQIKRRMEMIDLLSAKPGAVRLDDVNLRYAKLIFEKWKTTNDTKPTDKNKVRVLEIVDSIQKEGVEIGTQEISISDQGGFQILRKIEGDSAHYVFQDQILYSVDDGKSKQMSLVELKLCPEAVQAIGIAAANRWLDLDVMGESQLDGSDKAQQRKAYRMKWLDKDEDSFYVWLSMQNKQSDEEVRLLKAGADLDCQHDFGGITFHDWQQKDGWSVPLKRSQVKGLAESTTVTYVNQSVAEKMVDADSIWKVPVSTEVKPANEEVDSP